MKNNKKLIVGAVAGLMLMNGTLIFSASSKQQRLKAISQEREAQLNQYQKSGEETMLIKQVSQPIPDQDTIRLILENNNAQINVQDTAGNTPLMRLVANNSIKDNNLKLSITKYLLEAGADVTIQNFENKTAVMIAIENNNPDAASEMLKKDSSIIDNIDINGETAAFKAVKNRSLPSLDMLVKFNARLDIATRVTQRTALMKAVKLNWVDGVHRILQIKDNTVNHIDYLGATALIHAVKNVKDLNLNLIRDLINAGTDTKIQDLYDHDTFFYMTENPHISKEKINDKCWREYNIYGKAECGNCSPPYTPMCEYCSEWKEFCLNEDQCIYHCIKKDNRRTGPDVQGWNPW